MIKQILCSHYFFYFLQYTYKWYQKTDNDTIELEDGDKRVDKSSHYILNYDLSITKTYRCLVTNSIGAGSYCYMEVAGN